jgi:erythromycin esterase-like protein
LKTSLAEARQREPHLQAELATQAQQASAIQNKISALEKEYPQAAGTVAMTQKELVILTKVNAHLQECIKVIQDQTAATNAVSARYRKEYLQP